jgi:hypothetical protein
VTTAGLGAGVDRCTSECSSSGSHEWLYSPFLPVKSNSYDKNLPESTRLLKLSDST